MKTISMSDIPGFRRRKRDQKQFWLILFLMSLSFLVAETAFLLGDSLEASLAESRKNAYGEWQAAFVIKEDADEALVTGNPFFARIGRVRTAGEIPGGPEHASVTVGAMDETAAEHGSRSGCRREAENRRKWGNRKKKSGQRLTNARGYTMIRGMG